MGEVAETQKGVLDRALENPRRERKSPDAKNRLFLGKEKPQEVKKESPS